MRFGRLAPGQILAALAALVLLVLMATAWYGSREADLAREATSGLNVGGGEAGEEQQVAKAEADRIIKRDEKNPWHERRTIDRVLLVLLLVSVFLPLVAATVRAAGRRPRPPWTPSAFAALAAVAAALLLAYRIINQPGNNAVTTVKIGAPLGVLMLAIIGLGSAWAFRGEAEWAELPERAADDEAQSESRAPGEPSAG